MSTLAERQRARAVQKQVNANRSAMNKMVATRPAGVGAKLGIGVRKSTGMFDPFRQAIKRRTTVSPMRSGTTLKK